MTLRWYKCKGEQWCELFKLDLSHQYLNVNGVFIIFYDLNQKHPLYVGHGNVQSQLLQLSKDIAIKAFMAHGCYVTWAEANEMIQTGIVNYLSGVLNPKLQIKVPKAIPVKVNLPWE